MALSNKRNTIENKLNGAGELLVTIFFLIWTMSERSYILSFVAVFIVFGHSILK